MIQILDEDEDEGRVRESRKGRRKNTFCAIYTLHLTEWKYEMESEIKETAHF